VHAGVARVRRRGRPTVVRVRRRARNALWASVAAVVAPAVTVRRRVARVVRRRVVLHVLRMLVVAMGASWRSTSAHMWMRVMRWVHMQTPSWLGYPTLIIMSWGWVRVVGVGGTTTHATHLVADRAVRRVRRVVVRVTAATVLG